MKEIIVLNNSYLPIARTTIEKAICLLVLQKAISVKDTDEVIRSQFLNIKIPEVIMLKDCSYVHTIPLAYSRKAVFKRDNYTCQLCGNNDKKSLTLEHLIPKNRWKELSEKRQLTYNVNSWENTCCLCKDCNQKKSNKLPEEIGWSFTARRPINDFDIDWEKIFML
jgi:5-methylcytosine-specific restriction endonuclease McrA